MIPRDEIAAALGEGQGTQHLLEDWDSIQATLPPGGRIFFLDPAFVAEAVQEAVLEPDLSAALRDAARHAAAHPVARALVWQAHHRLKERPQWGPHGPGGWPLPTALGTGAPLFYLLALLGELPALREIHAAHNIPTAVHQATLGDLGRWTAHYHRATGVWGVASSHLPWYWRHLHGQVYELGRLQYELASWWLPARAYRHAGTGGVVALSEAGIAYDVQGQRALTTAEGDGAAGIWTAGLRDEDGAVVGHRILPEGRAERTVSHLPRSEWREVLAPGDAVLSLHIPQGAPLDPEACRRSLEAAWEFFPLHFPEREWRAFACHSWLLDPQLEEVLPPSSNIVRFLRQMYLIPTAGDSSGAFVFVFGAVPEDLRRAPRGTTLERALVDHVLAGGRWRGGGCFLFPEDLPAWGADIYRAAPHGRVPVSTHLPGRSLPAQSGD